VEDLGGQILGLATAARASGHERPNTVEISLVQLGETARVRLRGLDQKALAFAARGDLRSR